MPPIIHCVRHAQGFHNLSTANHSMHDPQLTELGIQQCTELRKAFPHHENIDLIVASPLRRTIYTALYSFEPVLKAEGAGDKKVIALPLVQETADVPCDTGSDPEVLVEEFLKEGKHPVDLGLVEEGWNSKEGKWAPIPAAIKARAREARRWLKARPEKEIVVVTHGGFLHFFTEDWEESTLYQGTGWANTEYRTFTFLGDETHDVEGKPTEDGGDNATLVETAASRERRGKHPVAPARAQQSAFYKQGMSGVDQAGLQTTMDEKEHTTVPVGKEVEGTRV